MIDISFPVTELHNSVKSNTNAYLITICIPTYNRVVDLKTCLYPILLKYGNSDDVEIIVIDNGSDDKTSDYLIANNIYSNTNFYTRECNAGFDINVLDCYYKANGKYVHFLGDDDILVTEAFDDLLEIIRNNMPDVIVSDYTIKTSKKIYNSIDKKSKTFDKVDCLLSYVGHHITFMSSITLKKQPVTVQQMLKYINFKFMHISLMLEILSGKSSTLFFSNKPIAVATDNNSTTYDVADIFLIDLFRSMQLNVKKLDLKKLESFFISIICHCIGSNASLSKLLFSNPILDKIGFRQLIKPIIAKLIIKRILKNLSRKITFSTYNKI